MFESFSSFSRSMGTSRYMTKLSRSQRLFAKSTFWRDFRSCYFWFALFCVSLLISKPGEAMSQSPIMWHFSYLRYVNSKIPSRGYILSKTIIAKQLRPHAETVFLNYVKSYLSSMTLNPSGSRGRKLWGCSGGSQSEDVPSLLSANGAAIVVIMACWCRGFSTSHWYVAEVHLPFTDRNSEQWTQLDRT